MFSIALIRTDEILQNLEKFPAWTHLQQAADEQTPLQNGNVSMCSYQPHSPAVILNITMSAYKLHKWMSIIYVCMDNRR